MGPISMTSALASSHQQDLRQKAARRRLTAGLPAGSAWSAQFAFARAAGPGMFQRFALRAAGWGRRPAVASSPAALVPQTYKSAAS